MVVAQFNYFDIAVLGIMFLSCVFALFRGFVKEILSLVAWVGSAYITVHFYGPFAEIIKPYFVNPKAGSIAASIILYVGSLFGFFILNRMIIKMLKSGSKLGIFDNILGFFFGALRGGFIVSLIYMMMSLAIKAENRPDWLEKAVTRPYVEKGAIILAKLAPEYTGQLSDMQKRAKDSVQDNINSKMEESTKAKTINIENPDDQNAPVEDREKEDNKPGTFDSFLKNLSTKP